MQKTLYTDVMIDLETLARSPDSVIISIGIVPFNLYTGEFSVKDGLHLKPDQSEQTRKGRAIDYSTVKWWMLRDDEARKYFLSEPNTTTKRALEKIRDHFRKYIIPTLNSGNNVRVWGNGPTFDISILEHAFRQYEVSIPWEYGDVRCVRTIADFVPSIKDEFKNNFKGTAHNPIDDCINQIGYVSKIVQTIYEKSSRG